MIFKIPKTGKVFQAIVPAITFKRKQFKETIIKLSFFKQLILKQLKKSKFYNFNESFFKI